MPAEFKISRLIYNWRGTWTASEFYNRDAIVEYEGKAYLCLVPNTASSNFYDDLNYPVFPKWQLLLEGKTWKNEWEPNTFYSVGNLVTYGGRTYICIEGHTSGSSEITLSKWSVFARSSKWQQDWQINTVYGADDVVRYGGIVYRCTTGHVSASTTFLGLEDDQDNWTVLYEGIDYKGSWSSSSVRYKVNDIVKDGPSLFICTEGHASSNPFDETKWDLWVPGIGFDTEWSGAISYQPGDIVVYGGYSYVSNIQNNLNIIPTVATTEWSLLNTGYNMNDDWSSGINYKVGDVVTRGGMSYVAIEDSSGYDPSISTTIKNYIASGSSGTTLFISSEDSTAGDIVVGMVVSGEGFTRGQTVVSYDGVQTVILNESPDGTPIDGQPLIFTGVNNTYWTILVPSVVWQGIWQDDRAYSFNDIVLLGNTTYRCIKTHAILESIDPSTDTTNSTWIIYTLHDRNNAMREQGDLVYNDGTENTRLPIDPNPLNPGTTTFIVTNASQNAYVINGVSNDSLSLYRGITYTFELSASGHPFWIKTALTPGNTADIYNDGVLNNGDDVGTITFTVPFDAPDTLYYICGVHSIMAGTINILQSASSTQTKMLKVTNSFPSWQTAFITPNVFYVTTEGFDGNDYPDRGKTWDHPYRTVAHACEVVEEGFFYADTKSHLEANKEFMVVEMYEWMSYQITNNISPFNNTLVIDEEKTKRDAKFVIDGIIYDISRGGNSQTVANAYSYFKWGSNDFVNTEVAAQMPYFIPTLERLLVLINSILNNSLVSPSYQVLNSIPLGERIAQVTGTYVLETGTDTLINQLTNYIIDALDNQTVEELPVPNQGATATVFVKSGTYTETLPIIIPANCAVVGDELRGTVIQPNIVINTYASSTSGTGNKVNVISTEGMYDNCPIQFVSTGVILDDFPSVTAGQTYYVIGSSITSTSFSISSTPGGSALTLTNDPGNMFIFGGDAIKDMFYMRNASGLRNMTLTGLLGTLTEQNTFLTSRPTGGSYVSLDPGAGPNDTKTWITKRSPYIQNVTNFGVGCTGMKVDGTLHNGGNKSMVCNDFTQILSDGIGIWCTGTGSLVEAVSVFTYYNYAGYFAEDGGRIRATNGNSSYGTFGVVAEGYDDTETPISGNITNRLTQARASIQSSFGINSLLLHLQYSNAGSNYNESTTNMLEYSNDFLNGWTNDGNVSLTQNDLSPNGRNDAWTLNGTTSGTDSSYLYQNITVTRPGSTYTNISGSNITGSGSSATFDITVNATSYSVSVNAGGTGYVVGNQILILGTVLGGATPTNDLTITVDTLAGSTITGVTSSGTVPPGSALEYTFSIHVSEGTSSEFDLYATWSGVDSNTSYVSYNFDTNTLTPGSANGGFTPVSYGREVLDSTWSRIWFKAYDPNALNTNLQFRIYPRGKLGNAGNTVFYGAQLQIGNLTFYNTTISDRHTSYADYFITGAGTGAHVVGDEIRSNGIFQVRVVDNNGLGEGGRNYLTSSNNAQGGNAHYIILSQSEINDAPNLERMRLFINSGTGAGQYGFIGNYNPLNKYAYMLKESFTPVTITASSSSTNEFTLDSNFNTTEMYIDMPIQFIPTYYNTEVTSASQLGQAATATIGGTVNTITVADTTKLTVNMPINFSGTTFGGVITNFTYYITNIIDSTTIQISNELFGSTLLLNTASGSMTLLYPANNNYLIAADTSDMSINMPIQFTGISIGGIDIGTIYYINDIISSTTFTISDALVTVSATDTNASGNIITVDSSNNLIPLNPIEFSGTSFGGLTIGTKYYISNIPNSTSVTVASSLLSVNCTETAAVSNLITVSSTSGFVVNNPIRFVGTTFGGITSGQIYYILAVNNSTTFTISTTIGGSAVILTTATGLVTANTTPASTTLTTASGTLTGESTSSIRSLTTGNGSIIATFSTKIFGGIQAGTDYYLYSITPGNPSTFQVALSAGAGVPVNLTTSTGSMQFGAVGFDHINPGTPIESTIDSTSLYFIEARAEFSGPPFNQTPTSLTGLVPGSEYIDIAYGKNYWIALADGNSTISGSSNGTSWSSLTLPISGTTLTGITYGNEYWVIITSSNVVTESGSRVLVSSSNGQAWRISYLPSKASWNLVEYGNGVFVAIVGGSSTAAYSLDHGLTWSSASGLPNAPWTALAYGKGIFVAVAAGTSQAAYSLDGQTWISSTMSESSNWQDIAFGNGRFIAVSGDPSITTYTFNGITWYDSNIAIQADNIAYGNGIFVALYDGGSIAYTTEDGLSWKQYTISSGGQFNAIKFGYKASTYEGIFISVGGSSIGNVISAGAIPKGRATVNTGRITRISMWEPGGGFTISNPTLTITDPNYTISVETDIRRSSGVLAEPTFIDRGTGYNTNSTTVTINGSGYADEYQTGLGIYVENITKLPRPGDNLVIDNNSTIYKVTNATVLYGTTAPNITAFVEIAPPMTVALSPENNESLEIRQLYSQVRLTGHDFLNIGYGNFAQSNYPGLPTDTELSPQNQAVENNYGRVFYTSTDQDGNFKVGNLFGVEQATGIVTLSASQFGLEGLEVLRLGGVAIGGSGVIVNQFSTDPTFIANSNNVVPTQKAIRSYLNSRLTQGGSNTFTGQCTAGTVIIGGVDRIDNTIPQGTPGSSVRMLNKVNIAGQTADIDGDMKAFFMFTKGFWRE